MSDASEEITETKAFKKAKKLMGERNAAEFVKRADQELKDLLALNSVNIQEAKTATKANSAYQKACQTKKDFDAALRESVKSCTVSNELAALVLSRRKASK